jgi:signal transduction histidine kinase
LQELRGEVTRLISELRLSLFDLRTGIEPHGGLGAAITAYLRTVGATSGFTVHITLNETAHRLPAGTEVELLRIVQEAVTNARKHAQAHNLWITCDIDPPRAWILVEDDGIGISGAGRHDSFGLGVMRERAARLHAHLQIRPRDGGGTAVEVRLAGVAHRRTLSPTDLDGEVPRVDDRAADR